VRFGQEIQALPRRFAASERLTLDHPRPVIHVVAGAVIDRRGRVLIAQRPAGKTLAGRWEFPGGKLEPGESRRQGLARELREEIGIEIREPRPLLRLRHRYPYGEVLLDVWVVRRYRGEPQALDGQALRWCSRDELPNADLLPADRPIIGVLRLPERLRRVRTEFYRVGNLSELRERRDRLFGVWCRDAGDGARAAAAGADFLVMREALAASTLASVCEAAAMPVFARGIGLVRAWELGASGTHALPMD
jgi:mutator protein MutT